MIRILFILFISLLNGMQLVQAQGKVARAYARPIPGEKAVQIKWIIPNPFVNQYHILRRTVGEKTFRQITTKPLTAISAVDPKAPEPVVDGQRTFLEFTKELPEKESEIQIYMQLFGVNAYTSNEFAQAAGMFYKDYTVVEGQTYEYAVSALLNGKAYSWAMSLPVRITDNKPEPAPMGLKVVQTKNRQVALSWALRADVLAYDVYRRRGNGAETKLNRKPVIVIDAVNGKRPVTQFTDADSTLREGETYYYRVAALDPFVNPGTLSQAAWLTLKDMEPPVGASALEGRLLKNSVRLHWKPSPSHDCIGYRLFRGTALEKPFQPVLTRLLAASDTAYTDETATEGATYYYYLRAEDQAGNGVNTPTIQLTHPDLTPPAMPAGLTVKTDTLGHVTLSWRANQEADLKGYFVYRALANTTDNYAQLQLEPQATVTFRDTLLRTSQNPFYYRLTAVDKQGNESAPALLIVRLPDQLPPAPPRIEQALAEADSVQIRWQQSAPEDVRIYHVLRRNEADKQPTFQVVGRTTNLSFTDHQLPGNSYSYAVVAIDSAGNSSPQSLPRLVELAGKHPLAAPTGVKIRFDERDKKLLVSWTASPPSADLAGYRVLARETDETFQAVTPLLTETQTELIGYTPGTTYEIAVVVIGQSGRQLKSDPVKATARN